MGGDPGPSTITRTWAGNDVTDSQAEFRRPGHGRRPLAEAGWERALTDYRPFLSYSDLERIVGGKPSEMYDAVEVILGLGALNAADGRLQAEQKELAAALQRADAGVPELVELLGEFDDPRATAAIAALTCPEGPDFATLERLIACLPEADDDHLRELRATAGLVVPDLDRVEAAAARLREAAATMEDVRSSGAEDAHQRAELLAAALEHRRRHPKEGSCPACGSHRVLDESWAAWAAERVDLLRTEATAARHARDELRAAVDAVRYLVGSRPDWIPTAMVVPWRDWAACLELTDPRRLADRAEDAALAWRRRPRRCVRRPSASWRSWTRVGGGPWGGPPDGCTTRVPRTSAGRGWGTSRRPARGSGRRRRSFAWSGCGPSRNSPSTSGRNCASRATSTCGPCAWSAAPAYASSPWTSPSTAVRHRR
ncbi:MAG TPA: hypothetical protein VLH10_07460 [Yinghuangia sp.]|nr:hypothetical protein [Yinghuangia sp.]